VAFLITEHFQFRDSEPVVRESSRLHVSLNKLHSYPSVLELEAAVDTEAYVQ
jgi:hypothetical protein